MTHAEWPDGFDALPKRFKDYIGQLETKTRALADSLGTNAETRVKVCNVLDAAAERYLRDDVRIEFKLTSGDRFRVYFAHNRGDDGLEISCDSNSIVVYPEVSNVIVLRAARWPK